MAFTDVVAALSGLQVYYRLGETSGTTITDSKNAVNGTLGGTYTQNITGAVPHDTDGALNLNGTTGKADIPDSAVWDNLTNKASFGVWVNPDSGALASRREIVQRSQTTDNWWFNVQSSKLAFFDPPAALYRQSTSTISEGVWSLVGADFDGTVPNVKFYINGVLDATVTTTMTAFPTTNDNVGLGYVRVSPSNFWKGGLDELFITNTRLGDSMWKQLYTEAMRGSVLPPSRAARNVLLRR